MTDPTDANDNTLITGSGASSSFNNPVTSNSLGASTSVSGPTIEVEDVEEFSLEFIQKNPDILRYLKAQHDREQHLHDVRMKLQFNPGSTPLELITGSGGPLSTAVTSPLRFHYSTINTHLPSSSIPPSGHIPHTTSSTDTTALLHALMTLQMTNPRTQGLGTSTHSPVGPVDTNALDAMDLDAPYRPIASGDGRDRTTSDLTQTSTMEAFWVLLGPGPGMA
ncbi:hypothetical protein L1987_08022 [Smallanthus sonchifolius]|uniref:Uncharacterized protein n=1 Tax=Smallanthus sonchifolius TaxID=185202 RepID=A0ACB9JJW5_9ASTR|nr:hypothetical protein L1987_08022 [Smallanthus sonchifolius]